MSENPPIDPHQWIVDASPDNFEAEVFDRSLEKPVVVDFWAAWCAPCRALAPILEKLTGEFAGQFRLVKANTDELPQQAAEFSVQGIPAIYAVVNGEVVDFFTGALPEPHIREWLERVCLAGSLGAAQRAEEIDPAAAEILYREAIEKVGPHEWAPKIGLARVLLAQEKFDECASLISELEARGFLEPEAEKLKAALDLHQTVDVSIDDCRQRAAAEPDNLSLRLELARALAGRQEFAEALETSLATFQAGDEAIREQARELMVDMFRVLPDDSELTREYRRKLSMAMY